MTDDRETPKRSASLAEQLAKGERMLGGLEADLDERTRPAFARPQAVPASTITQQPKGETANILPEEFTEAIDRRIQSMVAHVLNTTRGPNLICFIPKDRRPKWIAYPVVPEAEGNEFGTVFVFQCLNSNVEVRGRNLKILAIAYSIGRLEAVRISDGDFSTAEAYVTDIIFHPPEPGKLTWSEKGEYVPQTDEGHGGDE
jgi:hypothetical protein